MGKPSPFGCFNCSTEHKLGHCFLLLKSYNKDNQSNIPCCDEVANRAKKLKQQLINLWLLFIRDALDCVPTRLQSEVESLTLSVYTVIHPVSSFLDVTLEILIKWRGLKWQDGEKKKDKK